MRIENQFTREIVGRNQKEALFNLYNNLSDQSPNALFRVTLRSVQFEAVNATNPLYTFIFDITEIARGER